MGLRHQIALKAISEPSLYQLATDLVAALNDCAEHRLVPHLDPAIMMISYQIAFAGNGDYPDLQYYQKLLRYCQDNIDEENPKAPPEPPYKLS